MHGFENLAHQTKPSMRGDSRHPRHPAHRDTHAARKGDIEGIGTGDGNHLATVDHHPKPTQVMEWAKTGDLILGIGRAKPDGIGATECGPISIGRSAQFQCHTQQSGRCA